MVIKVNYLLQVILKATHFDLALTEMEPQPPRLLPNRVPTGPDAAIGR